MWPLFGKLLGIEKKIEAKPEFGAIKRTVGKFRNGSVWMAIISAAIDASGNVYTVGHDNSTKTNNRLRKYDSNGLVVWDIAYPNCSLVFLLPDGTLLTGEFEGGSGSIKQVNPSTGATIKGASGGSISPQSAYYDPSGPAIYIGGKTGGGNCAAAKISWPAFNFIWSTSNGASGSGTDISGLSEGKVYAFSGGYGLHTIDPSTGAYSTALPLTSLSGLPSSVLDPVTNTVYTCVYEGQTGGRIYRHMLDGTNVAQWNLGRSRKYTTSSNPFIVGKILRDSSGDIIVSVTNSEEDNTQVYKLTNVLGTRWPVALEVPRQGASINDLMSVTSMGNSIPGAGTVLALGDVAVVI